MKPLAYAALALLLSALEAALLAQLGGGVPLCLPAVLVAHLAVEAAMVEGVVGAAAIGYVLDLVTGSPKGLMTFLAVAAFLLARAVAAAVDLRGRTAFALLAGAVVLGVDAGAIGLARLVGPPDARPGWGLLSRALAEAVVTGLAAPLLRAALRRLDGWLGADAPELMG